MPRTTHLNKPAAMDGMPAAPVDLGPEGRRLWKQTLNCRPAAEWSPADAVLLAMYVRAVLDVRRLTDEINVNGEVVDGRVSPFVLVRAGRESLVLNAAKRLKLTPCSRYTARDVGRLHRHATKASNAGAALDDDDLLAGHKGAMQ